MENRELGKSGIKIIPLGLGGMPLGGEMVSGEGQSENRFYLGKVKDKETIRSLHMAMDHGINFFDTAPAYGAGHSERILGEAFQGQRDKVIIATKFGKKIDENRRWYGRYQDDDDVIKNIRLECEGSLRRLKTDYIDLYQFHIANFSLERAEEIRDILENLVDEGKIRFYGWSTNNLERGEFFARGKHCTALQFRLNVLEDAPNMLRICEKYNLAAIIRGPLASGFLTGKYSLQKLDQQLAQDDFRLSDRNGIAQTLAGLNAVQDILQQNNRTVVMGALGWIWARSPRTIPIPGFRTIFQIEENIQAMEFGPLHTTQMEQIEQILQRD